MKIVVNNIAASTGGALSILKDFYNYIKYNDTDNQWIFLLGDNYLEETENIKVITLPKIKKSWMKKLVFDFCTGKNFIKTLNPDAVFSLQNIITFGVQVPQVVYIHQSIPFQSIKKYSLFKSNERNLFIYQYLIGEIIKLSAMQADKVIVQTQWMKEALYRTIKTKKVINILPNLESVSCYKKDNLFDHTSFFYPTSESLYKNNDCIYKACELLHQKGVTNFKVKMTLENKVQLRNIEFIGRLPREQVLEEYNKSTLIFPSYIETFGLPMVEARQMGTIVLASDCEFSQEVLDGYENAYFFDPFKPEELAELMMGVLSFKNTRMHVSNDLASEEKESSWKLVVNQITEEVSNF